MTGIRTSLDGLKSRLHSLFARILEQRWTNIGLRAKMGLLVEIGLIGLIAIFLFLSITNARQTTQKILSERMMVARLSAANIDSTLRQVQSVLTILSERGEIRDPDVDPAERQLVLNEAFRQLSPASTSILLVDQEGRPVAAAGSQLRDFSEEELEMIRSDLAAIGEVDHPNLFILPSNELLTLIHIPVLDPAQQPTSFLLAVLDLEGEEFSPMRNGISLGDTGKLDVIDSNGRVLLSSHPGSEAESENDTLDQVWSRFFIAGKPDVETCLGCVQGDSNELTDEVIAFAPLSQAPWGVIVRQKASEVMSPVNRLLVQTLVLGAAAVLGALFLVWVTTSSVIRPVQTLTDAAERIAKGDLSTPIVLPTQTWGYGLGRRREESRRDEIGILAESFSTMRRQLKHSIDETNALNRELDGRVRERTQAAMAAQLEAQAARDDLRAIIDALSDELIVINVEDNSIQLINQAVLEQHPGIEEANGHHCSQVCHRGEPCENPKCDCPIPTVLLTGQPVRVVHEITIPGNGQKTFKEISASPMRDSAGKIDRVVELTRDVTEQKELAESLVRRNQQLSILNAVAITVNRSLNLEDILNRSLDAVLKLTEIDVGAIFLQEEVQGMLKLMAYQGLSEEAARFAAEFGLLDGSCGGVMEHGQIVIVPNLNHYRSHRARTLRHENLSTLVHVPLMSKGSVLGSMCVGTHRPRDFSKQEQDLLSAIGSQIAVAIENARLYAEVQAKERMRGELFMKAINAQEEERKRIARELHDDTSQSLAALLFVVEESLELTKMAEVYKRLEGMHDLVQRILDGVHKLIFDLRPSMLDHLGLIPSIRWFAESRLNPKGVRVSIEAASPQYRLTPEMETALFRIVQESIVNIARHAAARNVRIEFSIDGDDVRLEIEDDGVGFNLAELEVDQDSLRGIGLLGMQERLELLGGQLDVHTAHGHGTKLTINIPVQVGSEVHV